jgi:hypothetical protein
VVGDAGSRSSACGQPALGHELLVRLDDDAPGDAEVAGERPGRREPRSGLQAAGSDRLAQAALELGALRGFGVEREEEVHLDHWIIAGLVLRARPIPAYRRRAMATAPDTTTFTPTPRTRIRRVPGRGTYDRATVEAILDEALVCHLAFVHDGQPFAIPTLHARVGDTVYVHGSAASRMLRTLKAGVPACLTATLVDGLVLARSAFHHSMNYRSAVVVGELRAVEGDVERLRALEAFTERLVPGRWDEVRPPTRQELKGTSVLAMPLEEASAKVRDGGVADEPEDYDLPVWAGVVPLGLTPGPPEPDPRNLPGVEPGPHITRWAPTATRSRT